MPFITDEDDIDDGSKALTSDRAKRESAKNVLATLHNDLSNPQMYVQEVDPETGFPVRKTLVSGGLEYINDNETGRPDAVEYDIDAILSGDVSVEDAMATISGPKRAAPPKSPGAAPPSVPAPSSGLDETLRLLGFDFLHAVPTMPTKHVRIAFTGMATFQVPFACHAIVRTESLVVLVTDKRSVPAAGEMDFNVDRGAVQVSLVCPDQASIPIVAPVPRTVSFEIGILRCTLFAKRF